MKKQVYAFLTALLMTGTALAGEETIGTDAQKNLNIVIYNNDRALVRDTRGVSLTAGKNEIAYAGISGQIIPSSVILNGQGIALLENNFNFDVLSYESLLEKSLGETVTVQYMNPKTGIMDVNTAELIALNGSTPILRINGKVDGSYPGRILFNRIPANLRAKPTLVMSVASDKATNQDLTLNYMTTGLAWDANYVARLSADNKEMTLDGWVSLTNNSGVDYQNAHMQVVAGDVNLRPIERPVARRKSANHVMAMDGMVFGDVMAEEKVADYHMYTLPRTTDILDRQTKQVSLLNADNVGIQKVYQFNSQLRPASEVKSAKPSVQIVFQNTKENHLGIALPRGTVRLYQADKKGDLIFVGEDYINHVGNLEEVKLNMGTAFDISADAKRTRIEKGFKVVTPRKEQPYTDATYEVTLRNGTAGEVTVNVSEYMGEDWTILTETHPSTRPTATQAEWRVPVPAEGTTTLTYTVRLKGDIY